MIVSGHQAVYLPWLGLFHKLSLCDTFVYMDTVQYLENDWNNRNKIKTPQGWMWLTVPVDRKASKGKMLDEIVIKGHDKPEDKNFWQKLHWQSIESNYRKAKYFNNYADELQKLYTDQVWLNLIDICWAQFLLFSRWLELSNKHIVRMSEVEFEGNKDKLVLDHCKKLGANNVVFGTHGKDYVRLEIFKAAGIGVYFQDYKHPSYPQRFGDFELGMSIIDLFFNCGPDSKEILLNHNTSYTDLQTTEPWL